MEAKTKIGIIICDRYRTCAGGKCLRALRNREGAFSAYVDSDVELVGYTTCNGCPGGNIEYTGEEMVKNGAQVIHLATCLLVGYPPCPRINPFIAFLEKNMGFKWYWEPILFRKSIWRCMINLEPGKALPGKLALQLQ